MQQIGEKTQLYLWLHYGVFGNSRKMHEALRLLTDLREAYLLASRGSEAALSALSEGCRERLVAAAQESFMKRYVAWIDREKVGVCIISDDSYPKLLREITDPPPLIFYKGHLESLPQLPIAIVGARNCTQYGKDVARTFARDLTASGCTIVSGMAAGIDSAAAEGALSCEESPYPTIAVLGSGIDVIFPSENDLLYRRIQERGAIITEFLPKTRPLPENFPVRNRIMSGLSRGVVVVEAAERSGTSITAGYALEQGREVFAIPGRITDPKSVGTNAMIQRGEAKLVSNITDILQELGDTEDYDTFTYGPRKVPINSLAPDERRLCELLLTGEKTFDDLAELLPLAVGELNSLLTGLEFSKIIKPLSGRLYALDTINSVLIDE